MLPSRSVVAEVEGCVMKRATFGLVAALAWGGLAQAAQVKVELVQTLATPVVYNAGIPGAHSIRARSEVGLIVVRAQVNEREAPILAIGVRNTGVGPFNLTPQSIDVRTDKGMAVPLLTRDEFIARAEETARKRERRARLAMALDSIGSGLRDQPQRPDPSFARDVAIAQLAGAALVEGAGERGFLAQTVEVDQTYGTDIGLTVLPKDAEQLTVSVEVGGDTHEFQLRVLRPR